MKPTIKMLTERIELIHQKNEKLQNFVQNIQNALMGDVSNRMIPEEDILQLIINLKQSLKYDDGKKYGKIEALQEENKRLWYFIGVCLKDPNALRTHMKIGKMSSYAENPDFRKRIMGDFNNNTCDERPNNNY